MRRPRRRRRERPRSPRARHRLCFRRATGLRHVGPAAAAFAAQRLGAFAHKIDGAEKRDVRSAVTPTTRPALPSSVTPTMATTPEPTCFLPSSARLRRSLRSMPSTARASSLMSPTMRTPSARRRRAPPPMASFLLRLGKLALEPLSLVEELRERAAANPRAAPSARRPPSCASSSTLLAMLARRPAGERLDAAHAGGHRAFATGR